MSGSKSGLPSDPVGNVFDGFSTLNTKPSRPAIEPDEMYICDGFMPLGKGNLRTLPGVGPSIYTAPSGLTISWFWFGNIIAVSYCMVFLSDGSIVAVNTLTQTTATIAPAGTIQNPSPTSIDASQFGSEYIIIVSLQPNGYYVWDGSVFYTPGGIGPEVTISSGGYGYTSNPAVTAVGGSGSGATFTVTLQNGSITTITPASSGSGYAATDYVYLAFTGGGGNTTATATATVSGGVITGITPVIGGTGYTSTTAVAIYGGGGFGATATATVSGGAVTGFTVTKGGEQYVRTPTVVITDANNAVAQANVVLIPIGVSGSAVETFQSRVWVAELAKVFFTAAGSVTDFGTPDGGGVFQSRDSFLRVGFTSLRQSNGFLYLTADSSVNTVSGVTTSGTPATTTFSNQNVDPQIGTSWPGTNQVFSRNVVFANSFGVHAIYGGAVTKISNQLDGIYSTVPSTSYSISPSAAIAVIYGIHVYILLLPIIDQVTGQQVNKLLLWDGKRWWTASQQVSLNYISTFEINSVMTAYGSTGTSILPLFQTPTAAITKTVQGKLFADPTYFHVKMANRVATLVSYNTVSAQPVLVAIDNGVQGTSGSFFQSPAALLWTNATGGAISWTNASNAAIVWGRSGLAVSVFATSQPGSLLGTTIKTNAEDLTLISTTLVAQDYQTLL